MVRALALIALATISFEKCSIGRVLDRRHDAGACHGTVTFDGNEQIANRRRRLRQSDYVVVPLRHWPYWRNGMREIARRTRHTDADDSGRAFAFARQKGEPVSQSLKRSRDKAEAGQKAARARAAENAKSDSADRL
jgi:hypothetical protein